MVEGMREPGVYYETMAEPGAVDADTHDDSLRYMDSMVANLWTIRKTVRYAEKQGAEVSPEGLILGCKLIIVEDIEPDRFFLFSRSHPEIRSQEHHCNLEDNILMDENPATFARLHNLALTAGRTIQQLIESGEWDLSHRKKCQRTQEWLERWTRK